MRLLKKFFLLLSAPIRFLLSLPYKLIANSPLRDFVAPDPIDKPILDTIQTATTKPKEFWPEMLHHLIVLRKHIFRSLFVLIIGTILSFTYIPMILEFLAQPLGDLGKLQAIQITESLGVVMRLAFLIGLALSIPYIAFEGLWFLAPAISKKSRLFGLLSIPFVFLFFLVGISFCYYLMLPPALGVLQNLFEIETNWTADSYFKFVTNMMFWIGISFELPFISFVLSKLRIISPQLLIKNWRLAILILSLLAAVITPTGDPINMAIVLIPLLGLYGLSIITSSLARPNKK